MKTLFTLLAFLIGFPIIVSGQVPAPPSTIFRVLFANLPVGVGAGATRVVTNSDGTGCNGNGAINITCHWNGSAWIVLPASGAAGGDLTEVQATAPITVSSGTGPIPVVGIDQLINAQTGTTYTYLDGDRGKLVTHSNAAAIAATLPSAAGAGFDAGWFMDVQNRGAGTVTITPTTSTIDGAASLALTTNQGVRIVSDGTNYFTQRGIGISGLTTGKIPKAASATTLADSILSESSGVILLNGVLELPEITAPGSCTTNRVCLYAEDNGAGKTRIMVQFNTGTPMQIGVEP